MKALMLGLAWVLSSIAVQASGGSSLPQSICPAVTTEASEILSSIQTLRDDIHKNNPDCQPMDEKLANVSSLLGTKKWSEVKKVFRGEEEISLEGEDIDELSGIILNTSRSLSEVVSSLSGQGADCVDKKHKTNFLSRLSGVVREVSGIAGHVTGPYGMAVNLGGEFLSSALEGISNILPSRAYNFKDDEKENLFMSQFCSFAEIHKDAQDYLGLRTREEELKILGEYLVVKLQDIEDNCELCKGYSIAWHTKEGANKVVRRIVEDVDIVEAGNDRNTVNYTRCTEMHRAFHTDQSDFSAFIKILQEYDNPMITTSDNGLISDFVLATEKLKSHFPPLGDCFVLPPEEKVALSRDFNNLMRDEVLPMNEEIFGQQMKSFRIQADKKYNNPLGDYIEKSLERNKWLKKERGRVVGLLRDPNYAVSTSKIRASQGKISKVIIDRHFPRYLEFQLNRVLKQLSKTEREIESAKSKERKKQKEGKDIEPRVRLTVVNGLRGMLNSAIDNTDTFNRYCEYTRYLLLATPKINGVCEKGLKKLKEAYKNIIDELPEVASTVESRNLWKKSEVIYQTSRVDNYSDRINSWNERGAEKWCLKSEASRPQCQRN